MSSSKSKIIRNIVVIVVLIGVIAFIGIRLANNKKKIDEKNKVVDRSSISIPVNTWKVSKESVSGNFSLPAVIEPETEADISINATGKIKTLNFKLGTVVKQGQFLGSVDNSLKELNLQSTQLLLDKYEKDYLRIKSLYEGNAASEVDYLNAKYNFENTKTQIAQIKQQIADGSLVAPISGIIVKKNIEPGEFVNMGTPIATIVNVNKLKAKVMVGESNIYQVKNNMKVGITTEIYPGTNFTGTVTYVSPKGDDSHNYEVEIAIDNDKNNPLKGGTFVKVAFDLAETTEALQIPKIALVEGTKNPFVYIVVNNKSESRKLVLGRELGENIEVLSGLKEGDEIITSGQINLAEGSTIEVIKNK